MLCENIAVHAPGKERGVCQTKGINEVAAGGFLVIGGPGGDGNENESWAGKGLDSVTQPEDREPSKACVSVSMCVCACTPTHARECV